MKKSVIMHFALYNFVALPTSCRKGFSGPEVVVNSSRLERVVDSFKSRYHLLIEEIHNQSVYVTGIMPISSEIFFFKKKFDHIIREYRATMAEENLQHSGPV